MKQRTSLTALCAGVALAIAILLIYSLDRTAWLFQIYETGRGDWGLWIGFAAAVVIEVVAVALIASDSAATALWPTERQQVRHWAVSGLIGILVTQLAANLFAGYLRGWQTTMDALDGGAMFSAAWLISGFLWLLTNSAIPALIFILSMIEAQIVRLTIAAWTTAKQEQSDLEQATIWLEQSKADAATEHLRAEHALAELAQSNADAEQWRWQSEQAHHVVEQERQHAEQYRLDYEQERQRAAQAEATSEHWQRQHARLQALAEQPVIFSRQAVVSYARQLRSQGKSTREVEQIMGWGWSTLDNWIRDAEQSGKNGVEVSHG